MKKLWQNKWIKALVIFLPFTGIIDPAWYTILLSVYFVVGCWYLFELDA